MNEDEIGGLSQDDEPYEVSLERMREAKRLAGERRREGVTG